MENERKIWFKGNIVPLSEANINVLTPGFQFGANVFEGIRCYWNENKNQLYAFRLHDHTTRLLNSIKLIRFENKYSYDELIKAIKDVIKENQYKEDIAVRQTIFLDGMGSWFATGPTDMFIAPIAKKRLDPQSNTGINCCVSSWERINENSMSPKIKVGANYINSRSGQLEALLNGYDSAIFLNNQGKVSEGPGSCLFIVRDNCLITPPITASILESITRLTLITLAQKELDLTVVERDIDRTELYIADEVFLCGSAIEILPVISIDKLTIGTGKIGKITSVLHKTYLETATGENTKYNDWLTPIY